MKKLFIVMTICFCSCRTFTQPQYSQDFFVEEKLIGDYPVCVYYSSDIKDINTVAAYEYHWKMKNPITRGKIFANSELATEKDYPFSPLNHNLYCWWFLYYHDEKTNKGTEMMSLFYMFEDRLYVSYWSGR